jgi:hypothetical protein
MKVALCFIISYKQILNKEKIWREWIEPNKDIINVYFHYKNYKTIKSQWIKQYCIPPMYCVQTSYYHVDKAYMSLLSFSIRHDKDNQWFCFLTDSCVPIISPFKFRELFEENSDKSIIKNSPATWNVQLQKRANLRFLTQEYHIYHDPWFLLKREDVLSCLYYFRINHKIYDIISKGGLANESIFAIMLKTNNRLENVINETTHAADWIMRSTPTSPHIFKNGSKYEINFINESLQKNNYIMFLRKVDPLFPDEILNNYIKSTT